jgi:hypothetical protein
MVTRQACSPVQGPTWAQGCARQPGDIVDDLCARRVSILQHSAVAPRRSAARSVCAFLCDFRSSDSSLYVMLSCRPSLALHSASARYSRGEEVHEERRRGRRSSALKADGETTWSELVVGEKEGAARLVHGEEAAARRTISAEARSARSLARATLALAVPCGATFWERLSRISRSPSFSPPSPLPRLHHTSLSLLRCRPITEPQLHPPHHTH